MMAGCVKFKVTLHAQGTHAWYPQKAPAPSRRSLDDPRPADHREPQHLAVPRRGAVHHRSAWWHVWKSCPPKRDSKAPCASSTRTTNGWSTGVSWRRSSTRPKRTGSRPTWTWDCIQVPLVGDEELSEAVAADVPSYGALKPIHPAWRGRISWSSRDAGPAWCSRSSARTGNRGAPTGTVRTSSAWDGAIGPAVDFYVTPRCGARRASLTGGGTDHPA